MSALCEDVCFKEEIKVGHEQSADSSSYKCLKGILFVLHKWIVFVSSIVFEWFVYVLRITVFNQLVFCFIMINVNKPVFFYNLGLNCNLGSIKICLWEPSGFMHIL